MFGIQDNDIVQLVRTVLSLEVRLETIAKDWPPFMYLSLRLCAIASRAQCFWMLGLQRQVRTRHLFLLHLVIVIYYLLTYCEQTGLQVHRGLHPALSEEEAGHFVRVPWPSGPSCRPDDTLYSCRERRRTQLYCIHPPPPGQLLLLSSPHLFVPGRVGVRDVRCDEDQRGEDAGPPQATRAV